MLSKAPLRSIEGIRAKLFYLDAASTLRFTRVELSPCRDDPRGYCGYVYVEGGEGYLFVDLEGEGTVKVNEEQVHAVFKRPRGDHDNRFIPIPPGKVFIRVIPSMSGPLGEKLFSLKGIYLYIKEPWSFKFVVKASLLADLAEYTRDPYLVEALNKALDEVEIKGVTEEQLEAVTTYSIVKNPPHYVYWKKYYDIKLDPAVKPLDPAELSKMARRALEKLEEELERVASTLSGPTGVMYATAHAHIDVSWLWTPDVTRQKLVRTLGNVLILAEKYEMKFALSNVLYLKWLEEEDPAFYRKVVDAIKKGIIIPVSGMWVESDTNVVGGESLVRQFLYGQRYLLEKLGKITEIGWLPDSFGYTASLPQILVKSGIKIFFIHKLYWNKVNKFPYSLFIWEGVDGSQVIAVNYATYGSDLSPRQVLQAWRDHTSPEAPAFIAFGFSDGGGGPTWIMMERLKAYSRAPGIPRLVLSDPYSYYESVKNLELPVWRGELYLETHRGTYSTGTKIKKLIRVIEEALKDLEVVSFMSGNCTSYRDYWLELLEAEFHDVASATVVREAYEYYVSKLEKLYEKVVSEISKIALQLNPGGDYILVVNTLPWERVDVVPARVEGSIQQEIEGKVYSLVKAPPLGFTSYREGEGAEAEDLYADEQRISNGRVEVSSSGRVRDLSEGVDFVEESYIVACEDIPAEWDGWDIDPWYKRICTKIPPSRVVVSEKGSLRSCLDITYEYRDTLLVEKVCVWRHTSRVDYRIRGVVRERLTLFKKILELGFEPVEAAAEIPYGVVKRSVKPENTWDLAKFEFPVWRWLDVYTYSHGLAVLNKGRPGHSINGRVVGITLFKTPIFPNPHLDFGEVEVEFSLYPHRGDWRTGEVPRRALEYHRPLIASRGAQGTKSFLRIDKPNVLLETIKCSENGKSFVARMWESYGGEATLNIEGIELDFLELKGEYKKKIQFKPYEIKSIKIS